MPTRILIIRWSGMGDIIMTLPAVRWLKENLHDCHITYLTDIPFAGILAQSGLVDCIETIERRGFTSVRRLLPASAGALVTAIHLLKGRFHMAFDLQGFDETASLALLSRAPIRVGRVKKSSFRRKIYTTYIQADWATEHRSRYFVRAVAETCGCTASAKIHPPGLKLESDRNPTSRCFVGLNIGASAESRRWSEQHFVELARRLSNRGYAVRFFLGPQEKFLLERLRPVCQENHWDLFWNSRIEPLMKALNQCRLVVSNDTGPGHLAAALGIAVISLFSSGDPENVRPLAEWALWFRDKTDINRIEVAKVENACLKLLES